MPAGARPRVRGEAGRGFVKPLPEEVGEALTATLPEEVDEPLSEGAHVEAVGVVVVVGGPVATKLDARDSECEESVGAIEERGRHHVA